MTNVSRTLPLRDHTFMTPTWKGVKGVLEFVTCFKILLLLKMDLLFIFSDCRGGGADKNLVVFCGRHKWMATNTIIITSA